MNKNPWIALALALALGGPGTLAAAADVATDAAAAGSLAEEVLVAINDYRLENGLHAWAPKRELELIALEHSRRMASANRPSHEGFQHRFAISGADLCVENIAAGYVSGQAMLAAWRRSPNHDRNLLDPRVTHAGVSTVGRFVTVLACAHALPH